MLRGGVLFTLSGQETVQTAVLVAAVAEDVRSTAIVGKGGGGDLRYNQKENASYSRWHILSGVYVT